MATTTTQVIDPIGEWDEWPGDSLVVIACSGTKADAPAPAADLYLGQTFTLALKAARALVPDEWIRVLSARHGLVALDEVIEPYDTTWRSDDSVATTTVADQLASIDHSLVIALCATAYADRLTEAGAADVIVYPLAGGRGIGDQRHHLSGASRLVDDSRVTCPECGVDGAVTYADGACVACRDERGVTVHLV